MHNLTKAPDSILLASVATLTVETTVQPVVFALHRPHPPSPLSNHHLCFEMQRLASRKSSQGWRLDFSLPQARLREQMHAEFGCHNYPTDL